MTGDRLPLSDHGCPDDDGRRELPVEPLARLHRRERVGTGETCWGSGATAIDERTPSLIVARLPRHGPSLGAPCPEDILGGIDSVLEVRDHGGQLVEFTYTLLTNPIPPSI